MSIVSVVWLCFRALLVCCSSVCLFFQSHVLLRAFRIKQLGGMAPRCKYLEQGRRCYYGCTPLLTQCHRFQRQQCLEGTACRNGAHTSYQQRTPNPSGSGPSPPEPSPTMEETFGEILRGILAEIESIPAHDLPGRRTLRIRLLRRWHPDKWTGTGATLTALANKVTQWVTVNI